MMCCLQINNNHPWVRVFCFFFTFWSNHLSVCLFFYKPFMRVLLLPLVVWLFAEFAFTDCFGPPSLPSGRAGDPHLWATQDERNALPVQVWGSFGWQHPRWEKHGQQQDLPQSAGDILWTHLLTFLVRACKSTFTPTSSCPSTDSELQWQGESVCLFGDKEWAIQATSSWFGGQGLQRWLLRGRVWAGSQSNRVSFTGLVLTC